MAKSVDLPKDPDLFKPTLEVLARLGESGIVKEINENMISLINASQGQLDITYPKSGQRILLNRMSWARYFLKVAGLIDNPKRGVWLLTEYGRSCAAKTDAELKEIVYTARKKSLAAKKSD